MVRTVKSHREADEIDDQDFVSSTPDVLSQRVAVKMEGKNDDQKVSALRSKHSETEQRRRSKINERFQSLRDLIPENDQKRDKASFLLEVIQYIQFLQERIQMYEGTYHRWSPEPSKFMPWRSNSGPAENSADQQQVARNGSGHDDGIVATPILSNAQKSLESELDGSPLYRLNDNSQGSGNHESSLNMSVQPNLFDVTSSHPARASFPDPEPSASQSPSDYWRINPCASECAAPSYNAVEQGHLKLENGVNSIPNVYSQGLFNTLSDALQSAGVDLSHTKIVVQLDVGKRSNETAGTTTQSTEDSSSLQQMAGNSMQSCDRASKKPRTDGS